MGEGKAHPHKTMLLAGLPTPSPGKSFQEEQVGRSKNTAPLTICSQGLVKPPQTTNFPFEKLTCIHSGRQLNSSRLVRRCWKQKMSHYFFSTRGTSTIKRPWSIPGPLLSSKMTSFLSSGICLSFTFIMEWPVQFQPASPIPTLCFYPHLHKASGTHLQHHHLIHRG